MSHRRRQSGLSYTEVLVATALIALLLTPALEALNTGLNSVRARRTLGEEQHLLRAKLDDVLALPFATLDAAAQAAGGATTATSLSDTVTLSDGGSLARQVYLSRYDGDNADADGNPFTGTDAGLIWARVTIPGTALAAETLTAQ